MDVVRIATQQMLAMSTEFGEGTKDGSGAAAREFDFDDEE